MVDISEIGLERRARNLRVDTLVRLRWLAVAGQSAAALFTHVVMDFPFPIGPAFVAIACSAWLNIGLRLRYPVSHRLGDGPAFVLLTYDVLQLTSLLYLTGGLENPFSILFLAPVMISAVSLPGLQTAWLALCMVAAATFLAFEHMPLPWYPGQQLELPFLYVAGIWGALVLGAAFIGIYASRVATEARQLSEALTAAELVLAREQHLTQLDGLAAAAAHELGTPLATITLVLKELMRIAPPEGEIRDDIVLLSQEAQRCRTILSKIASLGSEEGNLLDEMTVGHLLEEVVGPQRDFGTKVVVKLAGEPPEPVGKRNAGILYGLGNLVENAIDFSITEVRIEAAWTADQVRIAIADDGPGFSPDVLMRLGEPYVTTRGPQRRAKSEEGAGLGLGLFIAKTLLERSGATVSTTNAVTPERGARVIVVWPRAVFENGRM
jgi:two-component system sensor histidine kinase RegB